MRCQASKWVCRDDEGGSKCCQPLSSSSLRSFGRWMCSCKLFIHRESVYTASNTSQGTDYLSAARGQVLYVPVETFLPGTCSWWYPIFNVTLKAYRNLWHSFFKHGQQYWLLPICYRKDLDVFYDLVVTVCAESVGSDSLGSDMAFIWEFLKIHPYSRKISKFGIRITSFCFGASSQNFLSFGFFFLICEIRNRKLGKICTKMP